MRFFTSEIYINNNNPLKIGAFLTIFKDFCKFLNRPISKLKYIKNLPLANNLQKSSSNCASKLRNFTDFENLSI
jgi:hypothetical protein